MFIGTLLQANIGCCCCF